MSQQTIRQQARRTAREVAGKRRKEHEEHERRVIDLAERVMVAIGERDAAVAETERRAGEALRKLSESEGLSLVEAVTWCGESVTLREAARLRRMAADPETDDGRVPGDGSAGVQTSGDRGAGSGGVGAGSLTG